MDKEQLEMEYQQFCAKNNLDSNVSPEDHIGRDKDVMLWLEKHIEARRLLILTEMQNTQCYSTKSAYHQPVNHATLLGNITAPNHAVH